MSDWPFHYFLDQLESAIKRSSLNRVAGRVVEVIGTLVKAHVPNTRIGEVCEMVRPDGKLISEAEVIGFVGQAALLTLYGDMLGISSQTEVYATDRVQEVGVGEALLGRVLNGMGYPIDCITKGPLRVTHYAPIYAQAPDPLTRRIIDKPLPVGIRAIDGLLTCGEGQRMGVFAAAGVGKSTLMSSLVRGAQVDITVIALIGERGREVREFIEHSLGEEGMRRSVVVVATSDKSSMERARAAYIATAIAEYFRDRGMRVLLLMDSVTRFARALREIGLAAGEPPTRRGFPPSVFAALPKLMERAGFSDKGSITAFYTVLVEGDDMTEPVADETRSILDGHIILSRKLATSNHYPAIDILQSTSRIMDAVIDDTHRQAAGAFRKYLATYQDTELLLKIGEYKKGNDLHTDRAIELIASLNGFLQQKGDDLPGFEKTIEQIKGLVA